MMQISLRQPWATLISTGIVRTIYLNAHPDTVPGRYSVFAERPEEGDSFSQEILQEMINHSLFGNIDTTHLPVEMNIGEVLISECVPVQRRNGIVYLHWSCLPVWFYLACLANVLITKMEN